MAIQVRRGALADYDETKMVSGEFAVTTDTSDEDQKVFVAFAPGDSKRILTESDIVPHIVQNIWTGVCSIAEASSNKTVTLDNAEGFSLTSGVTICVYFTAGNQADRPTLNVNGTGAKTVWVGRSGSGAAVAGAAAKWGAGIHFFTYQSGYWIYTASDPLAISILDNTKAPKASPALTGTPTAPTAVAGTNTTQIATTAFVQNEIDDYAPLASPALTGTPTAPTAASGTNTTQIATTAFVQAAITPGVTITDPNNDGHLVITIGGQ